MRGPPHRTAWLLACAAATACAPDRDIPSPCKALAYECTGGSVSVRLLGAGEALPYGGPDVQAAPGDLLLQNDAVALAIDALGEPHAIAPTGGTLIDLAPLGGNDQLNQIAQVIGILPDDAFHFTELEIVDETPRLVAVIARGHLDGHRDVKVATRYELRPCEPGVRARSELYNGSPDPLPVFLSDVSFWGNRQPLPFSVAEEEGFVQPELDLVELDSFGAYPYVAARASSGPPVAYGFLACQSRRVRGVNDPQVSALGTRRTLVRPGETLAFDRFLLAAPGPDIDSVARLLLEARTKLFGEPPPVRIAGRVVAAGEPMGGIETRASILVSELLAGDRRKPLTEVIPRDDGSFEVLVPPGPTLLEVRSFGRLRVRRAVPAYDNVVLSEEINLPAPATVDLTVDDGAAPVDAAVVFAPADETTRTAVEGTQHGRFETCAPWLGPPHGASPACNRVLVRGQTTVSVPAGHYLVYATAGPFATLDRKEVTLAPGEARALRFAVTRLPLAQGMLSVDLHVHGRASFDSSLPDEDRVLSFVAAGVDVIAATDHDVVQDYAEAIAAAGIGERVRVMAGVETTGFIPFLRVPGDDIPRVIGHFNFWPVRYAPGTPRSGAPWDELLEPGALFDVMEPLLSPGGLMMLNHPWDEPQVGRDLGYLRAVGYDPRVPVPVMDDGTRAGMLARRPGGGHGNLDFDVIEILNGRSITKYLQYRTLWWSLLSQGRVYAAAANSDSHSLNDSQLGTPRNLVLTSTTVASFDDQVLNADIAAGRMMGTYGIVISAQVDGRPFGLEPITPRPGARLLLEVSAAPWIPVDEIRLVKNGETVRVLPVTSVPTDPFGTGGLVRYQGSIPLADIFPDGQDGWLVVEAGMSLPDAADVDDDGVVDTTDNNGDGVIDLRDVEEGEDSGPLTDPPDPDPWSDDPRVHLTIVAPGTWPVAFTNAFLLDMDGDGVWEAPGL